MGQNIIYDQVSMLIAEAGKSHVLWAVEAEPGKMPSWLAPCKDANKVFEFVLVERDGPSGFTRTGLLFWDESLDMAENLAECFMEEGGHDPDETYQAVRANVMKSLH